MQATLTLYLSVFPVIGRNWTIALWAAKLLIFAAFVSGGLMRLTMPIAKLAAVFPWQGQVSSRLVRLIGCIDLLGGFGVLLPALTHTLPQLTAWAALGCCLLQVSAIIFHVRRGEGSSTPFNVFLLALSLFVVWANAKPA